MLSTMTALWVPFGDWVPSTLSPTNGLPLSSLCLITGRLETHWGGMPLPWTQSRNLLKCHLLGWWKGNSSLPLRIVWSRFHAPENVVPFVTHQSVTLLPGSLFQAWRAFMWPGWVGCHLCVLTNPFTLSDPSSHHLTLQLPEHSAFFPFRERCPPGQEPPHFAPHWAPQCLAQGQQTAFAQPKHAELKFWEHCYTPYHRDCLATPFKNFTPSFSNLPKEGEGTTRATQLEVSWEDLTHLQIWVLTPVLPGLLGGTFGNSFLFPGLL